MLFVLGDTEPFVQNKRLQTQSYHYIDVDVFTIKQSFVQMHGKGFFGNYITYIILIFEYSKGLHYITAKIYNT